MVQTLVPRAGGMAEWFKAAVLKTVERKFRGFESYSLRHERDIFADLAALPDILICCETDNFQAGEMTELADGARLLSECGG